ncbi:hypothetical protein SDC9_171884 [bioreactor metagenome]|uniref:Uncharacterized protein n=1 Tax=bioreactor metagenome TaxID=1076179 RepID=A0A645GCS6_9ZZZZ
MPQFVQKIAEHADLVREVDIKRPGGHPRLAGDVADLRIVVAPVGKQLLRRGTDPLQRLLAPGRLRLVDQMHGTTSFNHS